jgi:hypothetical protein
MMMKKEEEEEEEEDNYVKINAQGQGCSGWVGGRDEGCSCSVSRVEGTENGYKNYNFK